MIGLNATGPDSRKTEFFRQLAAANLFMADFYTMSKEDQETLIQTQMKLTAKNILKGGTHGKTT